MWNKKKRTKGCVDPKTMKKYNLPPDTLPKKYVEMFLPFKKSIQQENKRINKY